MPMPTDKRIPGQTILGSERVKNCTLRVNSENGSTNGIVLTNKAGLVKVIYISDAGVLACGTWDEFLTGATPA